MRKTRILLVSLFVSMNISSSFAQEHYRGMVQLFGNEEGAAWVTSSQWHAVTKTVYTRFQSMFPDPLPNTVREYYLVIRKADEVNDCSQGPEFRFWFTFLGKAGHGFVVSRDWGTNDMGTVNWVKVPESWLQAQTRQQVDGQPFNYQQTYFRLEARMPATCTYFPTMKIYSIYVAAIDKTGGVSEPIVFNNDPVAPANATYAIGEPAGNIYIKNGNVGIGTLEPGSYKLAVDGAIGARRLKITQQSSWSDFVFHPDYKLPSLSEVEKYIKDNQHLPEIPAATEVAKEGFDLGEMNKKLLQKVEELTLYLIDQQKQITDLKQQAKDQQQLIRQLQIKQEMSN